MGAIGDLYYAFRGDGARLQKDAQVEGAKAGTSLAKSTAANFKASWSGANIGKGFVQGLGLAGGLGAIGLLSGAMAKFTDVIGDSIQAAIADEQSIRKLSVAINQNATAWHGNMREVESVLKARMELGFSDDEQRESLALLVAATHDVNEALAIQRTAMDLARLKGISLADASNALIKVEAGQFRMLKSLGIQLRDGATQTEALAAVQAVAAGQAEAYAETTGGKLLVAQTKMSEKMEELGYKLLPVVAAGLEGLTYLLGDTAESFEDLQKKAEGGGGFLDVFASNEAAFRLERLTKVAGELGMSVEDLYRIVQDRGIDIGSAKIEDYKVAIGDAADESMTSAEKIRGAFSIISTKATSMGISVEQAARNSMFWMDKFTKEAIEDAALLRGEVFDATEIRAGLHDTRMEIKALAQRQRDAKTAEEKRQASDDIIQALDDEGEALEGLAATGDLTQKDVDRFTRDAKLAMKGMSKESRAELQKLIDKYSALAKLPNVTKSFTLDVKLTEADKKLFQQITGHAWGHGPSVFDDDARRAAGGPVKAGQPYIVGEKKPEVFVPEVDGRILPSVPTSTPAAGVGPLNLTVNLNGVGSDVTPQTARRFGQSVLDVVADGLREQTARVGR